MKNSFSSLKGKFIQEHTLEDGVSNEKKSTDINILLNRVKQDQKKKVEKRYYYSCYISRNSFIWCFNILKNINQIILD